MQKDKIYRHEWKYICSDLEAYLLMHRLDGICELDNFSNNHGNYNVRSLYFDDCQNSALIANINGENPRQKYRIRIYNGDISNAKLELKCKAGSMTYKESCSISEMEINNLIFNKKTLVIDSELKEKFYINLYKNMLAPKIIVDYERTAWVYGIGNIRITFDKDIGSSKDYEGFSGFELSKKPVFSYGKQVLEVKWDNMLPDCIFKILSIGSLHQTSFSKYCTCCLLS